jgi:peptide alpha-N-acetyltransferase
VKSIDAVLKAVPGHGEALAMSGLIAHSMGNREEGLAKILEGIRADISSPVVWHVKGIAHKNDEELEEAIKCYARSAKIDGSNFQILRDLHIMQLQTQDYQGMLETAGKMLASRGNQKAYWISYAVSAHLAGALELAVEVVDQVDKMYEPFRTSQPDFVKPSEENQLLLYAARLRAEQGKPGEACAYLEERADRVTDKTGLRDARARYSLAAGDKATAATLLKELISENPSNTEWHDLLQQCESPDNLLAYYEAQAAAFPKTRVLRARVLELRPVDGTYDGKSYGECLKDELRPMLRKGVPAAHKFLRGIIALSVAHREATVAAVDNLVKEASGDASTEPPHFLAWGLLLQAAVLSEVGDQATALAVIARCIEDTPSFVEAWALQGRIYKRAGDPEKAFQSMDEARKLDLADRYVNNRAAKYAARAGHVTLARELVAMFVRPEHHVDAHLTEMQAAWYCLEMGKGFAALGNYPRALHLLTRVDAFADEAVSDQAEYANYAFRLSAMSTFIDLVKSTTQRRKTRECLEASLAAIDCWIALADRRIAVYRSVSLDEVKPDEDPELKDLSEAERKKVMKKRRKQQLKAQASVTVSAEPVEADDMDNNYVVVGGSCLDVPSPAVATAEKKEKEAVAAINATADPLLEASKLAQKLADAFPTEPRVLVAQATIAIRRRRFAVALRALVALAKVVPRTHGGLALTLTRFLDALHGPAELIRVPPSRASRADLEKWVLRQPHQIPAAVRAVIDVELPTLVYGALDAKAYITAHLETVARAESNVTLVDHVRALQAAKEVGVTAKAAEKAALASYAKASSLQDSLDAIRESLSLGDPQLLTAIKDATRVVYPHASAAKV